MSRVIVLGARGRFGRAVTRAFVDAGWQTGAFARNWTEAPPEGAEKLTGCVADTDALMAMCQGADVIVNAINLPYEDWAKGLPGITRNVISVARRTGATVLLPGNVYNYGAAQPAPWTEVTPWDPNSKKGKLRVEMEESYRASGLRTIVLRGGDFVEARKSGNWFDTLIAAKAGRGKTVYPGPLDRVHAWAYLPDFARAAVMLAERREDFATFEEFCFEGYSLTGEALVEAIGRAVGKPQKVRQLPWPLVRLAGLFNAPMHEIIEMRYLWSLRHRLDGSKLARTLPDFRPTPLDHAMKEVLTG